MDINNHIPIINYLKTIFFDDELSFQFLKYLEIVKIEKDDHLFHKGDLSDSLYIIESGRITAYIELANNKKHRLAVMCQGTILGEMGLYTKNIRSASAIALETTVLYKLKFSEFNKMEKLNPELTIYFHKYIINLLSGRINRINTEIRALLS